jgi:hypothetical protein
MACVAGDGFLVKAAAVTRNAYVLVLEFIVGIVRAGIEQKTGAIRPHL